MKKKVSRRFSQIKKAQMGAKKKRENLCKSRGEQNPLSIYHSVVSHLPASKMSNKTIIFDSKVE